MVVFLVGGESRLMDALITKMEKDGHKTYLLTGKRDGRGKYRRVFERYNFPYDSESVREIFSNVNPDLVIFLGAYDTNYDWSDARRESVRFTADLTNLLSAYAFNPKGRFVYLSSEAVYGRSYMEDIHETEPASAKSFQAMAILQGENICKSYRDTREMDTRILRFDHLYDTPRKGKADNNPCFQMTLEMLKTNQIAANSRNAFSMIYQNDAVEFAYRVMMEEHPKYPLYHITSGEVITQMDLAKLIQQNAGEGVEIRDDTVGEGFRLALDGSRYQQEFDGKIFVPYEEGVKAVVTYMRKYSSSFLQREDTGAGWGNRVVQLLRRIFIMLIPYIENLICFIPFFMINNRAVGSQYFSKLDAYLLYVLLFAIVYGQQQAIFSALLATAGYCFRQMYHQSGLEVLMDYSTYIWMAQLFILGMVVGYMRDQIGHIKKDDEEEIGYLHGQLGDMTEINDSNVRMKQIFELQLVNQKDSLGKIYEITSSLDRYGAYEVLFYAAQMISRLMNTEDVAVYTVANRTYARLFSFTSPTARKLGNSIRYPEMEDMYEDLKEHCVYINKTMDDRYPLMAQAVYAEDEMQIILMLWGLPWDRMNLAESNRLTVISYLIQNAVVRANRYLEALHERRYLENSSILEKDAFTRLVNAFFDAKRNGLTECSLVQVTCGEENYKEAAKILEKKLRQTDYVGLLEGGLYVLLSNADERNARGVISRFAEEGYESTIVDGEVAAQ